MPVLAFSHYNLRAPRAVMETLRLFYCEVVGLRVGARPPFSSFGYWLYAGEGALAAPVLHLSLCKENEAAPQLHASTTFNHAAFDCADIVAYKRLLERRCIAYREAHVPQTNITQLFLHDPAGNGVELSFAREN